MRRNNNKQAADQQRAEKLMRSYSSMNNRDVSFLFGPSNPILGENSSSDPSQIPAGFFQKVQNLRFSNNELRVRWGAFALAAAPPVPGAAYRGSFVGYLDGSLKMFIAYRVGSATRVYTVTGLGTNVWGFNEITNGPGTAATDETAAEAGTNNGTRFTADGYVSFAIASDGLGPKPADILVFCNGVNAPRTYGTYRNVLGSTSTTTATHGNVNAPDQSLCTSQPDFAAFVDVRTSASTTVASASGVTLTKEVDAVTAEIWLKYVITGTGTGTVTLAGAAPAYWQDGTGMVPAANLKLNQGKQIILICTDSFTDPIWRYAKLIANSAGTPVTLWDPTNTVFDQPIYYAINDTQYLVAFNIETAQVVTTTPATDIRIEIIAQPPQTSRDLLVYGIMAGGHADATCNYLVSLIDSTSRAESGGSVCNVISTPKLGGPGGRGCAGSKVSENIPIPLGLYLEHKITYPHSPISPRVDYAMLYRKDPGETSYYFTNFMACPRTTWMYQNVSYYPDNAKANTRYVNRTGPPGSYRTIPYGAYLLSVNRRLHSYRINGEPTERWISGEGTPFRFSATASVTGAKSATNPVYDRMQGEEITGVAVVPGRYHGAAPHLTMTTKRVYRHEGVDSKSMSQSTTASQTGCAFPRSIATHNGRVYFVGSDRQVWRVGDEGPISLYQVDDQLRDDELTNCSAAADFFGYVLATKKSGDSTYNSMLRYDGIKGMWGSDRFEITGIAGLMRFDSGTDRRLLAIGDDGNIYWYEKPDTYKDGANYIPIRLKTRELATDAFTKFNSTWVGMVTDVPPVLSVPSADLPTFTIVQTGSKYGSVSTSEINMKNNIGNRLYRVSVKAADANQSLPGVQDIGITIDITANAPGNLRFKAIVANMKGAGKEPDVYAP